MTQRSPNDRVQDDEYARRSFSFRRMTRAQLWAISIILAALVVAAIVWALSTAGA